MKNWIRQIMALICAFQIMFCLPLSVSAQQQEGWITHGGKWYHYSKNGVMARNQWLKSGNKLFWMDEDGAMLRDAWVERDNCWYYLSSAGAAASGWQEIEGKWYYFDKETFIMAKDTTIDNWYVGKDGAWEPSN